MGQVITYGAATLGDDDAGDVIFDEGGGHSRQVQREPVAFADYEFTAGRGNVREEFRFTIEKLHADENAAATYWRSHPASLDASAALVFEAGTYTDTIADAALVSVERVRRDGKSTVMRYTFTGGQIVTT